MKMLVPLLHNNFPAHRCARQLFCGRVIVALFVFATTIVFAATIAGPLEAKSSNQKTEKRLGEIERQLKQKRKQKSQLDNKTKKLITDLTRLNNEIIGSAKSIHHFESEASQLEFRLRQLRRQEKKSLSRLKNVRKQTSQVLMALGRMARNPPEALMVQPTTPSQTVRSAILLRAAVPEIERRGTRLRVRLDELTAAQEAVSLRRYRLKDVMKSLHSQKKLLRALMAQKEKVRLQTQSSSTGLSKRVAALAREANSLRDLMETLRRHSKKRPRYRDGVKEKAKRKERRAPAQAMARFRRDNSVRRPITKSRGTLLRPAVGRIVGRYGRASRPA